jgi:4Fe-4S single cluster domain/Radical SAM superfamily
MIDRLSLEHPLVAHCNLRCANCDHRSPALAPSFSDVAQFERDLSKLRQVLRAKTLKLLGGEPLMHPNLSEFLKLAKLSGIADRIQVWTNGLLLHRLKPGDLDGCDDLIISVYPGIKQRWNRDLVGSLSGESTFQVQVQTFDRFLKIIHETFLVCKNTHEWSCHSFLDGFYYKCSRAQPLASELSDPTLTDGLDIHSSQSSADLERRLEAYLSCRNPLKACSICLGTSGALEPHRQEPRRERSLSLN